MIRRVGDDRPALAEIPITPAMIEAGKAEFVRWFQRDEHQESLLELPSDSSLESLLSDVFPKMLAAMPVTCMN